MKDDIAYIDHILLSISKILEYTKDLNQDDFKDNEMVQDAVIRNIEIIGEATKKVSVDFNSQYSKIPWREMSGMRDKLIHDYMGVDIDVVWKTIQEDIPLIKSLIESIDQ